jgi:hypothetical protein
MQQQYIPSLMEEPIMPHPNGGQGNTFTVTHSFQEIISMLRADDIQFTSNTGENMTATTGRTRGGQDAIVFRGENVPHGNVCAACWGYRINCCGTRVGQAVEAFDQSL